jgi:hypothetical protein
VQAGAGDAFGVSGRSKVDFCRTYLVIGDVNFLNHDCSVLLQVRITVLGLWKPQKFLTDRGNEVSELAVKKFEMTPPMHPAAS